MASLYKLLKGFTYFIGDVTKAVSSMNRDFDVLLANVPEPQPKAKLAVSEVVVPRALTTQLKSIHWPLVLYI